MDDLKGLSKKMRHELNRLYRNGEITRKQMMEQMKNGWFDHDRIKLKEKFQSLVNKTKK